MPIDHLYYPHIVDLIWFHLQRDALRAVRLVSKAWNARADLALSQHIVIKRKDASNFDAWIRCLNHPGEVIDITQDARICLNSGGESAAAHSENCMFCKRVPSRTGVVDLEGYTMETMLEELGWLECASLNFRWKIDVYRSRDPYNLVGLPESFASAVFYIDLDDEDKDEITFDMYDGDSTLVFNIDCYVDPTSTSANRPFGVEFCRNSPWGGMLRFIFFDKRTANQPVKVSRNASFIAGLLDYHHMMLVSVQFVGLKRLITDPNKLKAFKGMVTRDFVDRRAKRDANLKPRDYYKKECRSDMKRVEYLTMEEYQKKVGRRQFLIDTVK